MSVGSKFSTDCKVVTIDKPPTTISLSSFYDKQTVVFKIFRRFGCILCRYEARNLSNNKAQFDKLNVRVIGIGFDENGLQEWLEGKYWDFELYLNPSYSIYKELDFERNGWIVGIASCFYSQERAVVSKAKELEISGNFKGDGFQLGGTLIVDSEGIIKYIFKQATYADYPMVKELYKVCGGEPSEIQELDDFAGRSCTSDTCQ